MEFSYGKLILLIVLVLLIFGSSKIPKIGEDLGKAVRSFKKSSSSTESNPDKVPGENKNGD